MPKRYPRKSRRPASLSESELLTKLSPKQKQLLAEILGNISVAWFTAGVIVPVFLKTASLSNIVVSVSIGIILTLIFIIAALMIIKDGSFK